MNQNENMINRPIGNVISRPIGNVIKLSTSLSHVRSLPALSHKQFFVAVPAGAEAAAELIKQSSFFAIPSQVFALAAAAASSSPVAQILLLDLRKQIILPEEEDLVRSLAR